MSHEGRKERKKQKERKNLIKRIWNVFSNMLWIIIMLFFLIFIIFLLHGKLMIFGHGSSMEPTLDQITLLSIDLKDTRPERDDIVVAYVNKNDERYEQMHQCLKNPKSLFMAKRVIAVPGDDVLILKNNIYINGHLLKSEHWHPDAKNWNDDLYKNGYWEDIDGYFLLGDSPDISLDSTIIGVVYEDDIIGTVEWHVGVSP